MSSRPRPSDSSLWRSDVPLQRACAEYLQLQLFAVRLHCVLQTTILLAVTSQEKVNRQSNAARTHQYLLQNLRKI